MRIITQLSLITLSLLVSGAQANETRLRIGLFQADVTPPLGTPLCDAAVPPAREIVDKLTARGIVLLTSDQPIVLCAVDWVGIGNTGHDEFREILANAAGTTRARVAVHCLHQHDAPGCDFAADDLLVPLGLGNRLFDAAFARLAMRRTAMALETAVKTAQPITHVGYGKGRVDKVASNRRVLGPDGKVKAVRWSATKDEAIRAEPEGTIDPFVHLLSFWNGDKPIASLTYYATHPQSYYAQGGVSCDFPGLARQEREQEVPDVLHVHFNGAAGNVTAGKYNDGDPSNRPVLAGRLAAGMRTAWESTHKTPITAKEVAWRVQRVALPLAPHLDIQALKAAVADENAQLLPRLKAARDLAFAIRCTGGGTIDVAALRLGSISVLHMPGELFVEYQLAAQEMGNGKPVLMAAYGDYGAGYIGLAHSYGQGGYETGPASRVAPEVEERLKSAMREVLK